MELNALIINITKAVISDDGSGKYRLPLVIGIRNSQVVSTIFLKDTIKNTKCASLLAGYLVKRDMCTHIYFIGYSDMMHHTKDDYEYVLSNLSTESPDCYPEKFRNRGYVFGVIEVDSGDSISYAATLDGSFTEDKSFSIGTCEDFYPVLMALGTNFNSIAEVMTVCNSLPEKTASDIVIIDRTNMIENKERVVVK